MTHDSSATVPLLANHSFPLRNRDFVWFIAYFVVVLQLPADSLRLLRWLPSL